MPESSLALQRDLSLELFDTFYACSAGGNMFANGCRQHGADICAWDYHCNPRATWNSQQQRPRHVSCQGILDHYRREKGLLPEADLQIPANVDPATRQAILDAEQTEDEVSKFAAAVSSTPFVVPLGSSVLERVPVVCHRCVWQHYRQPKEGFDV